MERSAVEAVTESLFQECFGLDFAAAQNLIENYGTRVDPELHAEVLRRYQPLNVAPYSGFINPELVPVYANGGTEGEIIDVRVEYPSGL